MRMNRIDLECPYCRYVKKVEPEDLDWNEDSETEINCGDCEKIFIAVPIISIRFKCKEKE